MGKLLAFAGIGYAACEKGDCQVYCGNCRRHIGPINNPLPTNVWTNHLDLHELLEASANERRWLKDVELIPLYMPPYPAQDTTPIFVIKYHQTFLRYGMGPVPGYFWDSYGSDFMRFTYAFLALLRCPAPPTKNFAIRFTLPFPTKERT